MTFVTDALDGLASLPQPAVLAVTGALTLAECTLGVGSLAPGSSPPRWCRAMSSRS